MTPSRIAIVLLVLAAGVLAWPKPEEGRVRAVVESAVSDFAAGRFRACTQAFAEEFVDASKNPRIDKPLLVAAFRQLRFGGDDRTMGLFCRFVDGQPFEIELDEGERPSHAIALFSVEFVEIHPKASYIDPDAPVIWAIEVEAVLRRGEDGAWRFWRSSHRTLSGERPYR